MSDLIERQAVLDTITESINQFGGRYTTDQLNMWGLFTQVIKDLPSAQPTLYGYSIDYLALIADVMKKEGVSPEEAVRFFNDTQRIYQMLVDEIQKQVEGMVESCVT